MFAKGTIYVKEFNHIYIINLKVTNEKLMNKKIIFSVKLTQVGTQYPQYYQLMNGKLKTFFCESSPS